MRLPLQNFASLVQNMAAAVQSAGSYLIDLSVGSVLRAILEANASVALWMQWLIMQVLQMTRAATSVGSDLDSWMADMSLTRLPAISSVGNATFSRYATLASSLVPAGALIRTADGKQTFVVAIDVTNTAWQPTSNGYTIAPGQNAITVPIVAQVSGSAGNVLAGAISLLATAIPGVDLVANAAATRNGTDAETDAAFRSRFVNYITTRSRATMTAVEYAIASIQQDLNYAILQNQDASGNPLIGNFVVTVDDGTGNPPASLLSMVYAAVDAVRPIGSTFSVQPPVLTEANVSMSIAVAVPAQKFSVAEAVSAAITNYVNALPIGVALPLSRLAQLAYDASAAVLNVTAVEINGAAEDLLPGAAAAIKAGTVSVN